MTQRENMKGKQMKKGFHIGRTAAPMALAAATAGGMNVTVSAKDARPNIILIMTDDMGIESVGAYGCESIQTPRLDQMAKDGLLFTHAHSAPLCTPSRVQIMTGKYNHRNYVDFGTLRMGEVTFANLLKEAGYSTAIAGKWQLGGEAQTVRDFGFDRFCLWYIADGRDSRYKNPHVYRDGEWLSGLENAYGPDVFSDFVIEMMEEFKDGPFFIYWPEVLPHSPFQPTPDSGVPMWDNNRSETEYYKHMVEYMDKVVGRVLDASDRLDSKRETLILFTSDNGTNVRVKDIVWNGKTVSGGKGTTTAAGTHVPLIVRWSSRAHAGTVCEDMIDFSDFLPTLAELTGASIPEQLRLDGRSFLPQLNAEAGDARDWIFCSYDHMRNESSQLFQWAHTKRWKLYTDGRFYDLLNDRLEERPLILDTPDSEPGVEEKVDARDPFDWGAGVAGREDVSAGTSIHGRPVLHGDGVWEVIVGESVFSGAQGEGTGVLAAGGGERNAVLGFSCPVPKGIVTATAEGAYQPGEESVRGFFAGFQAESPDSNLLNNQGADSLYVRCNHEGRVTFISRIDGAEQVTRGNIVFSPGDQVTLELLIDRVSGTATARVSGTGNDNETFCTLVWPAEAEPDWQTFVINRTGGGSLVLDSVSVQSGGETDPGHSLLPEELEEAQKTKSMLQGVLDEVLQE
jgi:arylsulfatase A